MCFIEMTYTLVSFGEVLWDKLPEGKRLGGAPFNMLCHAKRLGEESIKAVMVSAVGEDELGKEILAQCKKHNVITEYITVDKKFPTSTVEVILNHEGNARYHIQDEVAWDHIPQTTDLMALAKKTDVVSFGSLAQRSKESQETFLNFAQSLPNKALCIFDVNVRQHYYSREIVEYSLELANVLKINEEELFVLAELFEIQGDADQVMEQLFKSYQLQLIALTKGEKGSVLVSEKERSSHAGLRSTVVNSIGAGDAFTAALIIGLLKEFDLNQINAFANATASYACSLKGAVG